MKLSDAYVKTVRGEKTVLIPLRDYAEMSAYNVGYDSYQDLVRAGYDIILRSICAVDGKDVTDEKVLSDLKRQLAGEKEEEVYERG